MKKICLIAFIALLSCGKDGAEPEIKDEKESKEQKARDAEGSSTKGSLKQGLAVEIFKGNNPIVGDIIIYSTYGDVSSIDFTQANQYSPFFNEATTAVSKSKFKEYGFELDEGKYLVRVVVGYPQTCPDGALCNPPAYFSVKEFEVLKGAKTPVKIDFKGIDDISEPETYNYIGWK